MTTRLNSPFLDARDDQTRQHVLALAERTAARLLAWVQRHPVIRAVRAKSLSLTLAASAPACSPAALDSTGRISMWIFTVDDLFDEGSLSLDELARRCEAYLGIARGTGAVDASDELAVVLQEVVDDLAQYPLFEVLRGAWADAIQGTLEGMLQEHRWRTAYHAGGARDLPSYEEYVEVGLYSIGGPPHFMTAAITIGDPSAATHIESLQRLARAASTGIRLANDLQSYAKEIAEGNINSVLIVQRESHGRTLDDARRLVQQQVAKALQQCRELASPAKTATGATERAFMDLAQFVCEFYVAHDYHHEIEYSRGGAGPRRSLASTAYDTAWVASLRDPADPRRPRHPAALRWLLEHQMPDGSWGGVVRYEHDRVISTLSALRPLLRFAHEEGGLGAAIERAQRYLWQHGHALASEPHELVGFELLLPTLIKDVSRSGLALPPFLDKYGEKRARKLGMLSPDMIYSRNVTIVHSLEFLGDDVDVERLASTRSENGSVGNSPAATAFLLDLVENEAAARYLEHCLSADPSGGVTVLHPCRVFDDLWSAYHRFMGGIPAPDVLSAAEYDVVRSMLVEQGGVSLDVTFPIPDADDTAVALILLHACGEDVPWSTLDGFRHAEGHFASYPYERHPSSGVNVHVLDALKRMPRSARTSEDIARVVEFLARCRENDTYWFDKWHISPYYATSHAIEVLHGLGGPQAERASAMSTRALDWIRHTQNADGSWGFYEGRGTVEETAYCLLALGVGRDPADQALTAAIERGLEFLEHHAEDPHPPLWMDKCLYLPGRIVDSVVDAARRRCKPGSR